MTFIMCCKHGYFMTFILFHITGLCTKLCEYIPGSLIHQSSLTGKTEVSAVLINVRCYAYAYTITDKLWEIPKAELTCGSEIGKGQCGVSGLLSI